MGKLTEETDHQLLEAVLRLDATLTLTIRQIAHLAERDQKAREQTSRPRIPPAGDVEWKTRSSNRTSCPSWLSTPSSALAA